MKGNNIIKTMDYEKGWYFEIFVSEDFQILIFQ